MLLTLCVPQKSVPRRRLAPTRTKEVVNHDQHDLSRRFVEETVSSDCFDGFIWIPNKGGCMVQKRGHAASFGFCWDWEEYDRRRHLDDETHRYIREAANQFTCHSRERGVKEKNRPPESCPAAVRCWKSMLRENDTDDTAAQEWRTCTWRACMEVEEAEGCDG